MLAYPGAISFANLQSEYGGFNPISLSEYYKGSTLGPRLWAQSAHGSMPISGTISMYHFRGADDSPNLYYCYNRTYTIAAGTSGTIGIYIFGNELSVLANNGVDDVQFIGDTSLYQVKVRVLSGPPLNFGNKSNNIWYDWPASGSMTWGWSRASAEAAKRGTIEIQIKRKSTGIIVATASSTFNNG